MTDEARRLAHLGTPHRPMTRVGGKGFNRLHRLDTDQGSFAVKLLNQDRPKPYPHADVFRLERAAFEAGIPMPEPISADATMVVHRWVDGEPVPEAPVSHAFANEIGAILARLHALDVAWPDVRVDDDDGGDPAPRDWPELARRAAASGQPWAEELAAHAETLVAIADHVDRCERAGPVVVTHRDIHPWNLLTRRGRPVVLDWEIAGRLDLASELGSTALSLAKGATFDDVDATVFRRVLDGYTDAGGTLPPPGPHWFVYFVSGWLGFTHWNVTRGLTGAPVPNGPDAEQLHAEVRNGLHGLPELYERLPQLEELLVR